MKSKQQVAKKSSQNTSSAPNQVVCVAGTYMQWSLLVPRDLDMVISEQRSGRRGDVLHRC
jgi:hypothetical protein